MEIAGRKAKQSPHVPNHLESAIQPCVTFIYFLVGIKGKMMMHQSKAAQLIESMRASASQAEQGIDVWEDKTRASTFHTPVDHDGFDIGETSQTFTNDMVSPVSMRGDMLVW